MWVSRREVTTILWLYSNLKLIFLWGGAPNRVESDKVVTTTRRGRNIKDDSPEGQQRDLLSEDFSDKGPFSEKLQVYYVREKEVCKGNSLVTVRLIDDIFCLLYFTVHSWYNPFSSLDTIFSGIISPPRNFSGLIQFFVSQRGIPPYSLNIDWSFSYVI